MECRDNKHTNLRDASVIEPRCKPRPHPALPSNPHCGCPTPEDDCWWVCHLNGPLETRIFNRPRRCIKPPCNYMIPAVPCADEKEVRAPPCDPLCFDWTVDEPGPNDSYGRSGLNWYDWSMDDINKYTLHAHTMGYTPEHPGFSKVQAPSATPIYQCNRPIECYSRFPGPVAATGFATDVNYFRDFRCASAKAPPPWKPPCVSWATNQHL